MTTVTTETLEQEYDRLCGEETELRVAARKNGWTEETKGRRRALSLRLQEILTIPPAGYELPKPAADLVDHAKAHGWLALVQWTGPGQDEEPSVSVQVGRLVTEADGYLGLGDRWKYDLRWHSRDCAPGKVRRFGSGHAVTPDNPAGSYAPSVKAIRAVIEQHPAPEVTS